MQVTKWLMLLLLSGCSINLTIETDYAAQDEGSGEIKEQVVSKSDASTEAKVDAKVDATKGGI